MTAGLLACPMCDAPARFVWCAGDSGRVKCTRPSCGTQGGAFDHERNAIAAWNTRAAIFAKDVEIAGMDKEEGRFTTLATAVKGILPIGDPSKSDSAVFPIYVRMSELRALHDLAAHQPSSGAMG